MTPDQQAKAQALGQRLIDTIGNETSIYDFNIVMNVLISVVAHFMAGIEDEVLRRAAFGQFGHNLFDHIEELRENQPDRVAPILTKDKLQ